MIDGLSVIALGLALGVQHATDADHVVAVATIVSRTRRFTAGALVGALWGVGHTATIAAVGTAIIVFKVTITPTLGLSMELLVAAMLILLGAGRILMALRGTASVPADHLGERHVHEGGSAFHSHAHAHGPVVHEHPHVHPPERLLRAVGTGQGLRSVAVGIVHGLSGSAAVALLALSTIRSAYGAVAYLVVFGIGTIAGMTAMTAVMALPLTAGAPWLARWRRALAAGTGVLAVGLGLYLAVQTGGSLLSTGVPPR